MSHKNVTIPPEPFLALEPFAAAVSAASRELVSDKETEANRQHGCPCLEVYILLDDGSHSRRLKRFKYPGDVEVLDALARAVAGLQVSATAILVRLYSAALNKAIAVTYQSLPPSSVLYDLIASGELERDTWVQAVSAIARRNRAIPTRPQISVALRKIP